MSAANKSEFGKRNAGAQSQKGEDRVSGILEAARAVLLEDGRQGFTMRKIAKEAGIAVGNLHYYYKTKDDILHDLLDASIKVYEQAFDHIISDEMKSDEEKLTDIIRHIVLDLGTRETTRFFPELWALANHDEYAAEGVAVLYRRARKHIRFLVGSINPTLSEDQVRLVSLFISASLEGHTMFVGYKKPWAGARELMADFAAKTLTEMVSQLTAGDFSEQDFAEVLPSSSFRVDTV